jgi:hypothetical protein
MFHEDPKNGTGVFATLPHLLYSLLVGLHQLVDLPIQDFTRVEKSGNLLSTFRNLLELAVDP